MKLRLDYKHTNITDLLILSQWFHLTKILHIYTVIEKTPKWTNLNVKEGLYFILSSFKS